MKPLYIVGTSRDVGKTTLSIGLAQALRQRGLRVAFTKPLGQRATAEGGMVLHNDERVIARVLGPAGIHVEMAIPIPSGRVEKEIRDFRPKELMDKVLSGVRSLQKDNDIILVEAMGHVAMGSVMGLSSADVCRELGARALLVSGGGIGRAIDDISLCGTFLGARGADMMGVIINKVWPAKYDRVKQATTDGLRNLGITTFGTVPYQQQLASPTMGQVYEEIGGEVLSDQHDLSQRIGHTIVAAMKAEHMVRYLVPNTLVVTPGDRSDNIKACLQAERAATEGAPNVTGLILTGGFRPDDDDMAAIRRSPMPVLLVPDDTYAVATKLRDTIFKITPDDGERIQWAVELIAGNVDIETILKGLE